MQLLVDAAPRFLSLFLVFLAVTLPFARKASGHRQSLGLIVIAMVLVTALLFVSSVFGLVALSIPRRAFPRVEFVLEDMVRLGLYWITAFLLYPTSLMEPLSLPVANDTTLSIAIWSGGVCASFSCLFDVLAYFRPGHFAYVGITFAVCTSVLIIIAFIRIGINHTILSPRSPQSIWLLLPLCQVPSIIVAVGRIQYRNSGLYTAGRFCLWAWTTGMLIFVRELCQICSRVCLPPSNKPRIHSKRRMICPSASEDFRSYHDPFAGPLAMRYNPMTTYSSFNPIHVQHSVVSLSVLHPYSRPTELAEIPSTGFLPTYHRPPIARGSGTELGQAGTSNAGSFHTAEGYWDASPEEEGIPSNKHDTAVNRIMTGSVSVCLPNIPAPAHLPPPLRTNVAPHQGSLNATSSVLPLAGQTSRSSFISRANVASWVDSRDRTPTQSLYVSSTSLDAPNKDKTKSIGEQPPVAISMGSLDPGNSSSQSMERSVVPSLRSIRSIPSLPDISSQLFEEPEATFDGSTLLTDVLVDISEISEVDLAEGVVKDTKIIESNGSPVVIKMHDDNFIPTL